MSVIIDAWVVGGIWNHPAQVLVFLGSTVVLHFNQPHSLQSHKQKEEREI